jgi:hypothetical protein
MREEEIDRYGIKILTKEENAHCNYVFIGVEVFFLKDKMKYITNNKHPTKHKKC